MMPSQTFSVAIERPADVVYQFASNPENLPQWAGSFCRSVSHSAEGWMLETPAGRVGIRFAPPNQYGVLDHMVTLPDGQSILNPMRVVPNGNGSEVLFTLFRPAGMTDEQFAADAAMIDADLKSLQRLLHQQA